MNDRNRVGHDLRRFMQTMLETLLALVGLGWLLGMLEARLSHDLIYRTTDFLWQSARLGFYAGAVLGVGSTIGRAPAYPSLKWTIMMSATIAATAALTGVGMFAVGKIGLLGATHWLVGSPNRHAFCAGLHIGFFCAGLGAPPLFAWWMIRRRTKLTLSLPR